MFYPCVKSILRKNPAFYYPVSTLLSAKWLLTGGEKQEKISNF